ncbi:unnamed protein product [Phaedon cochleariae]|uniref:SOCS box domain-containing protein n=1 Tax=Phaedon cochleariae TaxID=80249 RepID=A0A9P0DKV5_PHACE|nr:unnamed protein product [Phaedon cochleariae]
MESFLRVYFDYFNTLPRNSLHDRRKRKGMVDYISTLIAGCSAADTDIEDTSRTAIKTILQYHDEMKDENGGVCKMGKYHNILYVAMKLCYDWQMKDTETVSAVLEQIFICEKTFERILVGAIFGNKAPHFIAGWKSDFDSQEENLRAVVYFLDKANTAGLELKFPNDNSNTTFRFIDLPLESCGRSSPVKVSVQLGLPDKLLIFLRFGAKVFSNEEEITVIEYILDRLLEFKHTYPYNLVSCLQILLRVIPSIRIEKPKELDDDDYKSLCSRFSERYSDLVEDGLIPAFRFGLAPPELKHLCRCSIRGRLWQNQQLPNGIRTLPVPEKLWRYLDILED